MKYTFKVEEHKEYGTLGFCPRWIKGADPLSGMAVAHDIFEHLRGDDGSTEHELLALGSAMWIRGDGGYWHMKGSIDADEARHVSADFPQLFRLHEEVHGGGPIRFQRPVIGELRERCERVVKMGVGLFEEEMLELPTAQDQKFARNWLAQGYRRARERYSGRSGRSAHDVACCFMKVEDEADKLLDSAEVGMELTVHIKMRDMWGFTMEMDYPHDPYDY